MTDASQDSYRVAVGSESIWSGLKVVGRGEAGVVEKGREQARFERGLGVSQANGKATGRVCCSWRGGYQLARVYGGHHFPTLL